MRELQRQLVPRACYLGARARDDIPESATLSCAMHNPAITMTMTTGDPRPLAIHPIINMARASATFLEIVNEFRRRRLADAAPMTVIASMTIVAAPVRMAASVVVNVAREAAVTIR